MKLRLSLQADNITHDFTTKGARGVQGTGLFHHEGHEEHEGSKLVALFFVSFVLFVVRPTNGLLPNLGGKAQYEPALIPGYNGCTNETTDLF